MGGNILVVNQKILGVLFGVGAGAVWAAEAILGKILFSSLTLNPVQVTASEVFFATITAFVYVLARRERVEFNKRNVWNLLAVGLIGTVFAPLMFFSGLEQTFAVNATLIAHLQPLFVAILSFHLLKERLHRRDLLAGTIIILAAILITSRTIENLSQLRIGNFGDLMVFLATVSWAIVAIPGKQLTMEASSVTIVSYRFLIASIAFLPILFYPDQLVISSIYQVLLGVLIGLGYIFYYEGLKRLKASQVGLTELSSPFFTAVFAWHILHEVITLMQIVGALLLMSGLLILAKEESDVGSSE